MPEVRCPEHGIFAYRSAECPGCTYKILAARQQLAADAGKHYHSEVARVKPEITEQRQDFARQLARRKLGSRRTSV